MLVQDGLLWVSPLPVSEQAIAKRLNTLSASAMASVFTEVSTRLHAQPPPQRPGLESWTEVRPRFTRIAMVDGSTLEAIRKKTQTLQAQAGLVLAGRMMVMVEAFTHRPLWQLYTADAAANDKRFAAEILAAVSARGLLIFDLGFFSFLWFDEFTNQQKFFVTRLRQKTAYRRTQLVSHSPTTMMNSLKWDSTIRLPVDIPYVLSPFYGTASGIATSPLSPIPSSSVPGTSATCTDAAGAVKMLSW